MGMQVILDSSFAHPGSAHIWGGKKGEFRDWTNLTAKEINKNVLSASRKFCREVSLFASVFFVLPRGFSFCREVFLFAVRFFFLP